MDIETNDDGLTLPEIGRWGKRKYHFLSRYLNLVSTAMKWKWKHRVYIDLFSGAGFARIRDSDEIVATSAVLAATTSDPFTSVIACERDSTKADALRQRLDRLASAPFEVLNGDANEVVSKICSQVPLHNSLSVAFADPFGLHFDFETARQLASRRCDLIVLLADNMDALRNWDAYYQGNPNSNLDRFMGEPGWRDILRESPTDQAAQRLRNRYTDRLRTLGYQFFDFERIANSRNTEIYSLVYATKHKLGLEFWTKARQIDEGGQRLFGWT